MVITVMIQNIRLRLLLSRQPKKNAVVTKNKKKSQSLNLKPNNVTPNQFKSII
jgi:hypothetical protein